MMIVPIRQVDIDMPKRAPVMIVLTEKNPTSLIHFVIRFVIQKQKANAGLMNVGGVVEAIRFVGKRLMNALNRTVFVNMRFKIWICNRKPTVRIKYPMKK